MDIHVALPIQAAPEAIWQIITDIEQAPEYIQGIDAIELLEQPATGLVGLTWRETRTLFGQTAHEIIWITEAVPNQYYRSKAVNYGTVYTTEFRIYATTDPAVLQIDFGAKAQTLGARILSFIFRLLAQNATQKALEQDLEDIKAAAENHPYGHGKIEPLITFIVVALLVASAVLITYESIQHIRTPHEVPEPWTLYILGGIILWKESAFRFMRRKSEETQSSSLRADAWHNRSDALTSVAAFIGIAVAVFFGEGYEAADDWAALCAAGFILYNSYRIFRPALGEVMDEHRYDDLIETIRRKALEVEGITGTEKCYIRKSGMRYLIDLHARVDGELTVTEGHELAHRLQDHLKREIPGLSHVLIHIEPQSGRA